MLAGLALADAAAAEKTAVDRSGDPLPDGVVARLGSVRFRGRDGGVHDLRFSADGKTLLTLDSGACLRLWETSTGRRLSDVRLGSLSVRTVAISPNGKQIALSGSKRSKNDPPRYEEVRRLLDATSGEEVRRLSSKERDGDYALAFTPDGKYLMSLGSGGMLRIEEIASATELLQQTFPRDVNPAFALSPDGKLLVSASHDGTVRLWDVAGRKERGRLTPAKAAEQTDKKSSPDVSR